MSIAKRIVERILPLGPDVKRAIRGAWLAAAMLGLLLACLSACSLSTEDPYVDGGDVVIAFFGYFVSMTAILGVIISLLCVVFIVLAPSRSK